MGLKKNLWSRSYRCMITQGLYGRDHNEKKIDIGFQKSLMVATIKFCAHNHGLKTLFKCILDLIFESFKIKNFFNGPLKCPNHFLTLKITNS